MTRRIITAILLTVGAMLLLTDALTYWTIRSVLLHELDRSILARIALLPQVASTGALPGDAVRDPSDRFVIESPAGRNLARHQPPTAPEQATTVIDARFSRVAGGERFRTLTVRTLAHRDPADPASPAEPVTVVYSGSARRFDSLLTRLAGALLAANALVIATATIAVRRVSASALRPLSNVVETIGGIDERKLDRRIKAAELPVELLPVADRLNAMLARLEESSGRRRRFIADASHELRAPVAALITTIEVCIRRSRAPGEYEATLRDCLANARMLRDLVDALMEQVRGETYALDNAPLEPVDLHALLAPCIDVARALAAPRGITVSADIRELPVLLTAPERLRSIAINLLSNAVEYNRDAGRVHLVARYDPPSPAHASPDSPSHVAPDSPPGTLEIGVSDTGVGIPPDELARITEPFYRVDKARKPGAGHLGLGLFLVRTHADALQGHCFFESQLGQGTTIRVRLPVRPAVELAGPEKSAVSVHLEGGSANV